MSLVLAASHWCTNASLMWLGFATRVIWKSCKVGLILCLPAPHDLGCGMFSVPQCLPHKPTNTAPCCVLLRLQVLPVMALGTLVNKRSYSVGQYASAIVLVLGVVLFTLGDKDASPRFHPAGVALIAAAVLMDALCSNCSERLFFRGEIPASHAEASAVAVRGSKRRAMGCSPVGVNVTGETPRPIFGCSSAAAREFRIQKCGHAPSLALSAPPSSYTTPPALASPKQVVFYTSGFGGLYCLVGLAVSGKDRCPACLRGWPRLVCTGPCHTL